MPVIQLRRTANVRQMPTQQIAQEIETMLPQWRNRNWTPRRQKYMFSRAMELYHRQNATTAQTNRALGILRSLAMNYNRVWPNNPSRSQLFADSNVNYGSNSGYNSTEDREAYLNSIRKQLSNSANYARASAAVKKWIAKRPHTIHRNAVHIKLPENAADPVSYKNFKKGNEAVMVIKKRLQKNGAMRSTRTFYEKSTIQRLAGKTWNTIIGLKGSNIVLDKKDPLNRRTVYRRDLINVRFV
jgi:dihydroneopterin aldolase